MRIDITEKRLIVISDLHVGNPYSLATRKLSSFVDYLIDFAHTYGSRAREDHQLFVDLFRNGRLPGI